MNVHLKRKTASPGWYNTASFEQFANEEGVYAKTINGDAFSKEIKNLTIETIKKDLGKVDLVVYSLAAPRRTTPDGVTYRSVLKTTGEEFTNKNLNLKDNSIGMKSIPAATEEEVEATVKVMGGEDWKLWMQALKDADGTYLEAQDKYRYNGIFRDVTLLLRPKSSVVDYTVLSHILISDLNLRIQSILKERSVRQRNICIRQQMRLRKKLE